MSSSSLNEITRRPDVEGEFAERSSPLRAIKAGPKEAEFNERRIKEEEEREAEIKKLDAAGNTKKSDEGNKLPKTCLHCENQGYKHMNRHFCDQTCATSYYWMQPNKNPYKPKGGKTKKRRAKKTRRRRGKSYKKQQKKRSRNL
jgi:hypothetical protein